MNLQIIKSTEGKTEYVLLPIDVYHAVHKEIETQLKKVKHMQDYVSFNPADYIKNPIALARIESGITQAKLAEKLNVSQAYISKIERQDKVSPKLLAKVKNTLKKCE
jgi:DNA-binding XRE family transcriptional regulator